MLLTNLVAIILAAAGAFILLGIGSVKTSGAADGWVRGAIIVLAMVTLILLLPLLINVAEQKRRGQSKPLTYPVATHVHEAVVDYLESVPEVTLVTIGRVSVEPASSVSILLATMGKIPAGIKDELTRLVQDVRGGSPVVRIIVLQEAREEQAVPMGQAPLEPIP